MFTSTLTLPEFTSAADREMRGYNRNIILVFNKYFGENYIHAPLANILKENARAFNIDLCQVLSVGIAYSKILKFSELFSETSIL